MSLYYENFRYLGKNSLDEGLIVAAFEPDDGFKDSFLSMESIQDDYYDGTKSFDYGAKYNTKAVINITVLKRDGSVLSLSDFRTFARWLTGSRTTSWLDVGSNKIVTNADIEYSFLGRVTNLQQYKMDGRTVGMQIEFTSVSPWAYSPPQHYPLSIGDNMFKIDDKGTATRQANNSTIINVDTNGVLYNNPVDTGSYFLIEDDGTVYVDNISRTYIDNQTDDLYTYINLDINYQNVNCEAISIKNETLGEETIITDLSVNEKITLSSQQFIISDIPNKIFGDTFNFVWPRLAPGVNHFVIDGEKQGSIEFSYRYPMKVGDGAMDINVNGGSVFCGD